ncbi:MAG: arginine--tRNA ligase [Candidatus Dadabacteria bacterium]|nr:arginine--tRNA ligase [Candidatus Dadabacteria bacterium]MYA47837.1 arginine--tRNA ligase [Candidatus Dadabacteria bacterium]MYF47614.1 arginine--tRNA ligase [Candidatus Dadabacteria bacterium]MYG83060.1 arginine--tRNA ligase [Candidatus Dadabacteria bacterium]MYK49895.1 arginine--tRNA ligase [Candidatus Dadabacteria bacterium]
MKDEILKVIKESVDLLEFPGIPPGDKAEFEVSVPKKKEFGDFSTNAALIIGSMTGENPRKVAQQIVEAIERSQCGFIEKLDIAGPGFINFFVNETLFESALLEILRLGERYGASREGSGQKVIVEFVSANPTGYLHFGHARNAVVGDSVCRILSFCGYEVTREFYVNDAGRQMDMLGESVYSALARLFGLAREIPEDGYRGEYVSQLAEEIKVSDKCPQVPGDESVAIEFCKEFAYSKLLEEIKTDLLDLRVDFDNWYSERAKIHGRGSEEGKIDKILVRLRELDVVEEKEDALWFKASLYGDGKDWVIIKKDGAPTYFLSDIAYHADKYSRGFSKLINVWGADHHSHVSRLKSSMKALGLDESSLHVLLMQFVRLVRDGVEVPMSKRAGDFVTLREVLREVGCDATRFFLLMRSSDSHLDFDLSLAKKESSENPVYYVQYANARISSLMRNSAEAEVSASEEHLDLLSDDEERNIVKILLRFPEVVRSAADSLSPHKVVYYLQELAAEFHFYYNKTRILDSENADTASARLYLARCVQVVIENGLGLLGISAPRSM